VVLIISNTFDPTVDIVVRELRRRGTKFVRFNTDEYPAYIRGRASIERGGIRRVISWDNRDQELDLGSVTSVWYRRPQRPVVPAELEPAIHKFATDECHDFICGLWYSLECQWISHPDSIRRAEHKVYQLSIAHRLGLPVPKTLVSNDPVAIREFESTSNNGVVAKAVFMGFIDNPPRNIFTSLITSDDLRDDDSLRVAPVIFQERVRKACDIRVTVIGEDVFATQIRTSLPESMLDWRASDPSSLTHSRHVLPSDIEDQCLRLVKALGLSFGAIDLAIDLNGSYIFFEINPNGQWAWLEPVTNYPLTASLVNLLEGKTTCRS
jgi:glutathione synthase/RimK-type ligase-like ATP-grasp enzyme